MLLMQLPPLNNINICMINKMNQNVVNQSLFDYKHQNYPEFTVTEVSNLIKRSVEDNFEFVRVRGEISGLKVAPSGHIYFSLKDSGAVLASVCWKGVAANLKQKLEEGLEVVCTGSVSVYTGQSKYQLVVRDATPAGVGALMALLEKRKQQFAKEGLFDANHKKKVPFLPKTIAVITSPTGAVIQDILHRIEDRYPVRVVVWPVLVQGDQAAQQIAKAVYGLNNIQDKSLRPDVIIVARGGGSIEDLWPFNEEIVVRAVFNSDIPIISAVGHETDTTLIDYVSDLRAPTPTAAAEFAVPVKRELELAVQELSLRHDRAFKNCYMTAVQAVQILVHKLPNVEYLINNYIQRLDDLGMRIVSSLPKYIELLGSRFVHYSSKLVVPNYYIELKAKGVSIIHSQLNNLSYRVLKEKLHNMQLVGQRLKIDISRRESSLEHIAQLLESYNYTNVLKRGFAVVRNKGGSVIRSVDQLPSGIIVEVELSGGSKEAKVE